MFRLEKNGRVAVVRLDRPPVNAVRFDDWSALPDLVCSVEADPDVEALVFTGLPHRHFCGGNDVNEFAGLTAARASAGTAAVRDGLRAVQETALPVIAAVHGAAVGSGFMLACVADIRIATADARFGLPEVLAGAYGGYRIAREVLPQGEARWLAYTGRPISGERAFQIGFVQACVDDRERLEATAVALADEIGGVLAGRLSRKVRPVLNAADRAPLWEAYDLERFLAVEVMGAGG